MPSLVLFGRSWLIGSDDLVFPFVFLVLIDFIWLVVLIASLGACGLSDFCSDAEVAVSASPGYYVLGQTALFACSLVLNVIISLISARGAVMETEKRKALGPLLYFRIGLFVLQHCWSIAAGTLFLGGSAVGCNCALLLEAEGIGSIVYESLLFFAVLIGFAVSFNPSGARLRSAGASSNASAQLKRQDEDQVDALMKQRRNAARYYSTLCGAACCAVRGSRQRRKEALAELVDTFVNCLGDIDLVASDFAVGMLLVRDSQSAIRRRLRAQSGSFVLNGIHINADRTRFVDAQHTEEIEKFSYFAQYACVVYGYAAYMVSDGCSTICSAMRHLCCDCCSSDSRRFYQSIDTRYIHSTEVCEDDFVAEIDGQETAATHGNLPAIDEASSNVLLDLETSCCVCQRRRTRRHCELDGVRLALASIVEPSTWYNSTKVKSSDSKPALLYYSACDRVDESPVLVAYDPLFDKLVVSIRGTLSVSNALTDGNGEPAFVFGSSQPDLLAHRGILRSANVLFARLSSGVLQRALKQTEQLRRRVNLNSVSNEEATESQSLCDIVVVGHSLGAGLAALISAMLRSVPAISANGQRRIEALAYSPPGGLVSRVFSEQMQEFVTSIVIGDDGVPRIGISQFERLRDDVLAQLNACRNPKWKLIVRELLQTCRCVKKQWPDDNQNQSQSPSESETNTSSPTADKQSLKLIMPGNVVHIMRVSKRKRRQLAAHLGDVQAADEAPVLLDSRAVYVARRASALEFDRLLLTGRTLSDHMPYFTIHALQRTLTGQREAQRVLSGYQFL